jgi:hypothetical protein
MILLGGLGEKWTGKAQRRKAQAMETHLRTVVDFLFSRHMITRG